MTSPTKEQQATLQALTEKIVEGVPGIEHKHQYPDEWEPCAICGDTEGADTTAIRDITLEDVLRAAKEELEKDKNDRIGKMLIADGFDMTFGGLFADICCRWNFGLPLHQQKPETITFLHSLLIP